MNCYYSFLYRAAIALVFLFQVSCAAKRNINHNINLLDLSLNVNKNNIHIDNKNNKLSINFIYLKSIDLWFGETETSIEQYKLLSERSHIEREKYYMAQYGYTEKWPYFNVTDSDVVSLCNKLNEKFKSQLPNGYQFRPPTVEEWEIAARVDDNRLLPWGDSWPPQKMMDGNWPNLMGEDRVDFGGEATNIDEHTFNGVPYELKKDEYVKGYYDGSPGPCPVENSGKSCWGIYGMGGNVSEWCLDNKGKMMVLKDGDYLESRRAAILINSTYKMSNIPYKFNPLLSRRRSYYGSGMRIVIGRKLAEDLNCYLQGR